MSSDQGIRPGAGLETGRRAAGGGARPPGISSRRLAVLVALAAVTAPGGMPRALAAQEEAAGPVLTTPREAAGTCLRCHRALDDEELSRPARHFPETVHADVGITCEGCHGGDAGAEEREAAHQGFLGRPPRRRIPELCARCHSNASFMRRYDPNLRVDQLARYRTSVHGQRLYELGDTAVAVCVDCHTAHDILPPDAERSSVHPQNVPETCGACHADPDHMAEYGIPTDQLDEYRESVHWNALAERGDLSAPVCNDCHGNHGAVPPGYASVGRVCAECHARTGEYFALSPHDTAFDRMEMPGCATCHQNHRITRPDDEMLGMGGAGVCGGSGCHTPEDAGGEAALAMRALIDSVRVAFARADSILTAAEHAGMPVDEAQFELSQGRNALVGARALTHTANLDSVRARADTGSAIAAAGFERGEEAFAELAFRRRGLAVSAGVILLTILGLVFKIRQVEEER